MPGPFYFAWVNPGTAFNPAVHNVWDEDIFSAECEQQEGDFAGLTLTIRNPNIGLLAPARKVWAWVSWFNGTSIQPLFFGRLVGIPSNINKEFVDITFTARPVDYASQKTTLANTLRGEWNYDPIWLAEDAVNDPDTVLEARSELWHIDRVTHVVTTSDVLVGEDGTEVFTTGDVPYDSVGVTLNQTPLRSVTVDGTIGWGQAWQGVIPIVKKTVSSYAGGSLVSDWPKSGGSLSGGYAVAVGSAVDWNNIADTPNLEYSSNYENTEKTHAQGDTMSASASSSTPLLKGYALKALMTQKTKSGIGESSIDQTFLHVPLWTIPVELVLSYDTTRKRTEHVKFTLRANSQAIVTLPDEDDTLLISLSARDVGETGDIGDIKRGQYIPTARGQRSLQYLIALARANLLMRSRAVQITFQCRFQRVIDLTLRMNAQIFDDRLPGHSAVGKIITYKWSLDGDTGVLIGTVTIGCSVGYGGAVEAVDGDPSWVSADWVAPGWQSYDGQTILLPGSDVSYTAIYQSSDDDGLRFPLTRGDVVLLDNWHGNIDDQITAIGSAIGAAIYETEHPEAIANANKITVDSALKDKAIWYELNLRNLDGQEFNTDYNVIVSDLEMPKQIDLEAAT